jgi:anti-sigma factor RsiW
MKPPHYSERELALLLLDAHPRPAALRAHLDGCATCRARLASLGALEGSLERAARPARAAAHPHPAAGWAGVRRELHARPARQAAPAWAAVLVVALLVTSLSLSLFVETPAAQAQPVAVQFVVATAYGPLSTTTGTQTHVLAATRFAPATLPGEKPDVKSQTITPEPAPPAPVPLTLTLEGRP